MIFQKQFSLQTKGRGTIDITREVDSLVRSSDISTGLCHLFIYHTSASLMLCENADPAVRSDLERFFSRLVPDGDSLFIHIDEGVDDMPAHIRSILTKMDLTMPVSNGRLDLGTWQGIYLWEHRHRGHQRKLAVTVMGE
jgi:secondary thiamine-phosphate synthase enzyme